LAALGSFNFFYSIILAQKNLERLRWVKTLGAEKS
jgi:hypothetical protein